MPFATRDGVRLYWRLEGGSDAPPLVLLNSIGTDMSLWDAVMPTLRPAFRVLRIDTRGHGASDAPPGDYALDMLAQDVATVMDAAEIRAAAVAGVSLGGMTAMQLALQSPGRVSAAALICTSAAMDAAAWSDRVATVRARGTATIAPLAVQRFLSPAFAAKHPAIVASLHQGLSTQSDDGYAGAAAAIRDMALVDHIAQLTQPVLLVSGKADISTPYIGHGSRIMQALPHARHVELDTAHLPPIEAPTALGAALREFLAVETGACAARERLFEDGLVNRRRILGDDWVDRSLAARTPFNSEFQAMITRIAWSEIWGRPGLDEATRRLLVVAITASLGRWEEFGLHVRAGLAQNGFTRDELREVLMQTAIYAGVPVANTGFAEAGRIITDLDAKDNG